MGVDDHDTFSGLTPLQQAAQEGDVAKVVELLDAGADVNIQANGEVRLKTLKLIRSLSCAHLGRRDVFTRREIRARGPIASNRFSTPPFSFYPAPLAHRLRPVRRTPPRVPATRDPTRSIRL